MHFKYKDTKRLKVTGKKKERKEKRVKKDTPCHHQSKKAKAITLDINVSNYIRY